jgi:hypothetical protein
MDLMVSSNSTNNNNNVNKNNDNNKNLFLYLSFFFFFSFLLLSLLYNLIEYLNDNELVLKENNKVINDCKIGIDGFYWLNKFIGTHFSEGFSMAIGGIPITFTYKLEKELDKLKKLNVKPVFVFNGVNCHNKGRSFKQMNERFSFIKSAWNTYERGQFTESAAQFLKITSISSNDLINWLLNYFEKNEIEFIRSPYLAWPQVSNFFFIFFFYLSLSYTFNYTITFLKLYNHIF